MKRKLVAAWRDSDAEAAERALESLAKNLEKSHPGAAPSLREGVSETLTVTRLHLPETLRQSLRSTNAIESAISVTRRVCRHVKRWRDGEQVLRWMAAAVQHAQSRFRRIKGYRRLPQLKAALQEHTKVIAKANDAQQRIA